MKMWQLQQCRIWTVHVKSTIWRRFSTDFEKSLTCAIVANCTSLLEHSSRLILHFHGKNFSVIGKDSLKIELGNIHRRKFFWTFEISSHVRTCQWQHRSNSECKRISPPCISYGSRNWQASNLSKWTWKAVHGIAQLVTFQLLK